MPWSPDPGTPIHGVSESLPVDISIAYNIDPLTENAVQSYSAVWLTTPLPSLVSLVPDGATRLRVVGPNATGMTIINVSYILGGVINTVQQWTSLPPGVGDIFKYTTNGSNIVTAQFRVTANLAAFPNFGGGGTREATFTLQAVVNYSTGRDRLVSEIAARL